MNQDPALLAQRLDDLDQCFRDQLLGDYFTDPVTSKYGHSYEKSSILDWLQHSQVCPYSKQPLFPRDLIPNVQLKESTIEYLKLREALNPFLNPETVKTQNIDSGTSILKLRSAINTARQAAENLTARAEECSRHYKLAEDDYCEYMRHNNPADAARKQACKAKMDALQDELQDIRADTVSVNRHILELENTLEREERQIKTMLENKNVASTQDADETIKLITSNRIREKGKKIFESDKKKAYDLFTQAIEAYAPFESHRYYFDRAAAAFHLGRIDQCIADCNKSIEINKLYSKAYKLLGDAYYRRGQKTAALNEGYRKALECDPNNEVYANIIQRLQTEFASKEQEKRKDKDIYDEEEERQHEEYQRRFGGMGSMFGGPSGAGIFGNIFSSIGSLFPSSHDI